VAPGRMRVTIGFLRGRSFGFAKWVAAHGGALAAKDRRNLGLSGAPRIAQGGQRPKGAAARNLVVHQKAFEEGAQSLRSRQPITEGSLSGG
jgi:hypothetical protein